MMSGGELLVRTAHNLKRVDVHELNASRFMIIAFGYSAGYAGTQSIDEILHFHEILPTIPL
jgi:hypothetical protein